MRTMHNTYNRFGDSALMATIGGMMEGDKGVRITTPKVEHSTPSCKTLVNRLELWRKQQEVERKEAFVPRRRATHSTRRKVKLAIC